MKQKTLSLLFLFLCGMAFTACEETTEPTAYDNWRERNDAFIDSLAAIASENFLVWRNPETRVTTNVPDMNVGELYAIEVQDGGTSAGLAYTYAKKLVDNFDGTRLLYTDNANIFMHCSYINGQSVLSNFEGYTALDQLIPQNPVEMCWPSLFDEPSTFDIDNDARIPNGLAWVLQFARTGERWLIYVPYNVGYGVNDSSISGVSIVGSSVLTYDVIIDRINND